MTEGGTGRLAESPAVDDPVPVAHYLVTRFNVRLDTESPGATDEWLTNRLALFDRYTRPCVDSQTVQPYRWLVLCDSASPPWFLRALAGRLGTGQEIVLLSSAEVGQQLSRHLQARTSVGQLVITTRVDNDDCVSRDFIETIRGSVRGRPPYFLNLDRGLQVESGRSYDRYDPSNAFITCVETRTAAPLRTVFVDGHDRLGRHAPVRGVRSAPTWIQVVHGGNLANATHGIRCRPSSFESRFACDLGLTTESSAAAALARAGSALRLAARVARRPHRLVWLFRVAVSSRRS